MKKLFLLILLFSLGVSMGFAQAAKTRFAIVGLDHDHVWDRMPTLLENPGCRVGGRFRHAPGTDCEGEGDGSRRA